MSSKETNTRLTYKLSDIIKELKLTRKIVPVTKVIINWLKGTEFDTGNLTVDSEYNLQQYRQCKKYIDTAIKNKLQQQREQNKFERVYLYIYIGGTPELKNQYKIEAKDHLSTKVISPKGCDKYCTENQIGKPQNWIKLPVILMANGNEFDVVKKLINEEFPNSVKVSNNIYRVVSPDNFLDYIQVLRTRIFSVLEKRWFENNYDI